MKEPTSILVPTDFSDASEAALAHATMVASRFGAHLHVLHIVPDPHSEAWSIEATGMNLGALVDTWQAESQRRLDELPIEGPHTCTTVVGQPHREILRYAKDQSVDLIVMGTHGRGALEHLLLGSVAERVVRTAPCPVTTVRDGGE